MKILESLMMLVLCALTLIGKSVYTLFFLRMGLFQIVADKMFKYKIRDHRFPWAAVANHVFLKVMKSISTSKLICEHI